MLRFGLCFPKASYVLTNEHLQQIDATHWILDLRTLVGPEFYKVRDVCLFLANAEALDPSCALSLFVQAGGSEWQYRGCVCHPRPSEVFPLQWTAGAESTQHPAQIGITIEPLTEVATREESVAGSKEEFARRVAMDLFRFMESFHDGTGRRVGAQGDNLVVPANCLDRWFTKFQNKFRLDPDFLTRPQTMS